jgi:hypothetical protein
VKDKLAKINFLYYVGFLTYAGDDTMLGTPEQINKLYTDMLEEMVTTLTYVKWYTDSIHDPDASKETVELKRIQAVNQSSLLSDKILDLLAGIEYED